MSGQFIIMGKQMNIKVKSNIVSSAEISEDKKYRYNLYRVWDTTKPTCIFICLNPSTADASFDDPTVNRCIRFAQDWEVYGSLCMINLFAFRTSNPTKLIKEDDPIGPENDKFILQEVKKSGIVIAAWGAFGLFKDRGKFVKNLVNSVCNLYCLKLNTDGTPSHPLYLRKESKPILF